MRQLTTSEILALNIFLQMETNSLAMAKAGINVIGDEQLRTLAHSGISSTEGRIKGLQQFIAENNITSTNNATVNIASTNSNPTSYVHTIQRTSNDVNVNNSDMFTGGVV